MKRKRAQIKVRLAESLRREIEFAAAERKVSMNTVIVDRLVAFDGINEVNKFIAERLLDVLDPEIIQHIARMS